MSAAARRILLVCQRFEPHQGVGALRGRKCAEHLARMGWQVRVLTVKLPDVPAVPLPQADGAPPIGVVRTPWLSFDQPIALAASLKRALWTRRPPPAPTAAAPTEAAGVPARSVRPAVILARWLGLVDPESLWAPWLIAGGMTEIRRRRPCALWVSGAPFSAVVAATVLGKLTHTPVIVDYRDHWTGRVQNLYQPTALHLALEIRLERWVLGQADHVTAASDGIVDLLVERHRLPRAHFTVMRNGYDPDDLPAPASVELDRQRFRITHAGNLYGRDLRPVLGALAERRRHDPAFARCVELELIGPPDAPTEATIARLELDSIVRRTPFLPQRSVLARQAGAGLNLVVLQADATYGGLVPSKLYDLAALGRPVLALGPSGELAELVNTLDVGWFVPAGDLAAATAGARAAIDSAYTQWLAGAAPRAPSPRLAEYARATQVAKLAVLAAGMGCAPGCRSS